MIPRYCLVLTLPVGYTLATKLGVVSVASGMVIGVWLMAFVWLALVYAVHHYQGRPFGQSLRSIDLLWRIGLVLWLIWVGSQGLRGAGHIGAPWLAAKLLVFAFHLLRHHDLRVRGAPLAPALRELLTSGSTLQLESDHQAYLWPHSAVRAFDLGRVGTCGVLLASRSRNSEIHRLW